MLALPPPEPAAGPLVPVSVPLLPARQARPGALPDHVVQAINRDFAHRLHVLAGLLKNRRAFGRLCQFRSEPRELTALRLALAQADAD